MKRFGRNQRRKLREQVEALEDKLYGSYERATGRYPQLRALTGVFLDVAITERKGERDRGKEAEIEAVMFNSQSAIFDLYAREGRPLVEFDGYVWHLRQIDVRLDTIVADSWEPRTPSRHYIGGPPSATIKLVAKHT